MQRSPQSAFVRASLVLMTTALAACGGGGGGGSGPPPPAAPSSLSYPSPQDVLTDAPVSLAATVTGSVTSYAVSPPLPTGLVLNGGTGAITGTPTTESAAASYTITASNAGGSTTFVLSLSVTMPPTLNDTVGAQPDYYPNVAVTRIQKPFVTPEPSPRTVGRSFFYRYGNMRGVVTLDMNNDGLDDLFVAPSFFENRPALPVEIWINKGDGTFSVATAEWIAGPVPVTSFAAGIVKADFNGDGRVDIFVADSGHELRDCAVDPCDGASNKLLLSAPDGKLTDATTNLSLPANNPWFNHVATSAGDLNGDGLVDIAVPRFNDFARTGDGVAVFMNRGNGIFDELSAQVLSDEVAFLPYSYQYASGRPPTYDRQGAGAASVLDVNGDGIAELVTCSYGAPDRYSGKRTIRIHSWSAASSSLREVARFDMPNALAAFVNNEPGIPTNSAQPGCSSLSIADVNNDRISDLLLQWETWGYSYVHLALGTGQYGFSDATIGALGSYATTFSSEGHSRSMTEQDFLDVNGDGRADIVYGSTGVTSRMLVDGLPTVKVNDGNGVFVPQRLLIKGRPELETSTGCATCSYSVVFGRFFPRTDGRRTLDLLLWSINEDRYLSPDQERWIVLRAFKAR